MEDGTTGAGAAGPGAAGAAPGGGRHARYPDALIRAILRDTRTVALVGASADPARPSHVVLKYLLARGYAVAPVNPGLAGQDLLGRRVAATLAEAQGALGGGPIGMVEVFRKPAAAGGVVDEALALDPLPKVVWMQLGVRDPDAAARAEARGVRVIMDRCPKIEYGRLSGEIGWMGVNARVISARRPVLAAGLQKLSIADRGPRRD